MKNLKKILAWVLLVCMVLTLASCGKKDEEKGEGKSAGKKVAQNQRTFAGVVYKGFYIIRTLDNGFEFYFMNPAADFIGKYTKNANGTYTLESGEEWGGVTLTPAVGDLYRMTACEKNQEEFAEDAQDAFIRLMDDSTFAVYEAESANYIYEEDDGKKIFRIEYVSENETGEIWQEGNILSEYMGEVGTYTSVKRGTMQLLNLTLDGDTVPATLEGDTLTIDNDGDQFVMTRMSATKFFCLEDGGELIVDLRPDGTLTVLEGNDERVTGNITFEAGKKLELSSAEYGEMIGIVVDGDVLRLLDEGEEAAALKAVASDAELMKSLDEAANLLYPELGEWTMVGAEGEGAEDLLAAMKEVNGGIVVTFDGDKMVFTATENGETVETMAFYYYFTDEGQLNIYNYSDYYDSIDEYLDCVIDGDTMKLTGVDARCMIFQRK